MSSTTFTDPAKRGALTFEQFRHGLLWIMFASSFVVKFEPAPVDLTFFLVFIAFAFAGLRGSPVIALLVTFLTIYNLGGVASYLAFMGEERPKAGQFIATSVYMGVMAVFFAAMMLNDTERRLRMISTGWITGAFITAILAILGALNIAGLSSTFSFSGRALGLFKDPNVMSTYIIFPAQVLLLTIIGRRSSNKFFLTALLLLLTLAIFLSFSRGAWINFAAASFLAVGTTFVLSREATERVRIIVIVVIGVLIVLALMAALLSIPAVHDLFLERFSLSQSYDVGETGRFGNQANSIPLLLKAPLGFGPGGFSEIFDADPHNVYLNAFASYSWLGGVSYLLLTLLTMTIAGKTVMMRGPWQKYAIATSSTLFTTMLQGVQIDSDHWRHFYWLLGMIWGLYAATSAWALSGQARNTASRETP